MRMSGSAKGLGKHRTAPPGAPGSSGSSGSESPPRLRRSRSEELAAGDEARRSGRPHFITPHASSNNFTLASVEDLL